jgi:hypothetical protein
MDHRARILATVNATGRLPLASLLDFCIHVAATGLQPGWQANGPLWRTLYANISPSCPAAQTRAILAKIDALLAEVGSSKSKLLQVQIWLADIRITTR